MVDLTRRNFFRGKKISTPPALRLPWVINEQRFIDGCTQCGDCITSCEENIIIKGDGGYPQIDFSKGECTFCQQCNEACNQPLFIDDRTDNKNAWQFNIQIKDNCLAMNQVVCQSCQDCCETEAISFKYTQSNTPQPQIELDKCNSCGACVSVCPQTAIELTPKLVTEFS